jgi:type II secretory pathway component GspD/PulD (secretin)
MNSMLNTLLAVTLAAGSAIYAADSPPPQAATPRLGTNDAPIVIDSGTNAPGSSAEAQATAPQTQSTANATPIEPGQLRMNFRGASLDQVLNYFVEAAGFTVIVKPGTSVRGRVDIWSDQPMTKEEAADRLDTVLNQNGLAAIRNGKNLTIVNKDEAKTQNIPVIQGSDPSKIPISDKVVTQIIPVRFVEVTQLLKDLQPLVSSVNSTITANEAGNAIVITDTQAVIHKVAEVVQAIDSGAEDFTDLRVFHLTNADPNDTADLLSNLFPDDTRSGNNNGGSQSAFGGFRSSYFSRRFGGFGGSSSSGSGDSGGSNSQNQRMKKRNRVIAVADQRTSSLVVSASRDLMEQIAAMIDELDNNKKGRATVKVYQFQNADPRDALPVLQDLFNKNMTQNTRNNSSANQTSPLTQRSTTQNQQNSSTSRSSSSFGSGSRGSFGQ